MNDAPAEAARVEAFRASLRGPIAISIVGASAYWLDTPREERCSPESPTSTAPLAHAHVTIRAGGDPRGLRLACRLASGERYVIAAGPILAVLADWAAGATPRRRASRTDTGPA